MRRLCPNFDNEDGLDTVLEVPVPDEMFGSIGGGSAALRWQNMRSWLKSSRFGDQTANNYNEFLLLLKLVGSPLIPFPVQLDVTGSSNPLRDSPSMEASMAKYILHQYIAATGGLFALNSVSNMCAIGKVEIVSSDIHQSGAEASTSGRQSCDVGGFVLWQKNPDLWYLELVVSGCKLSAGCDGKLAWSQSSSNLSLTSRSPPRPLRRFFQGLDPRAIASLFSEAVHTGEKTIKEEDCFILKRETTAESLLSQSTPNTELMHHTVWGYFSQRTGLLVQFEDTKLVKMKTAATAVGKHNSGKTIFWETTLETSIEDYRYVDGIKIAHYGTTKAVLHRYGGAYNHRGRLHETWRIEELDFNVWGLSMDSFLPPSDVRCS